MKQAELERQQAAAAGKTPGAGKTPAGASGAEGAGVAPGVFGSPLPAGVLPGEPVNEMKAFAACCSQHKMTCTALHGPMPGSRGPGAWCFAQWMLRHTPTP